jgi:hypothetical protein
VRASVWLLAVLFSACAPGRQGSERAEAAPPLEPNASPSASESGAAAIASRDTWEGTYVSEAGSLYVVDGGEWAGVRWRGDDASVGLGEGVISLTIQGARVTGTGSGPIGDVVWLGAVDDERLTASVQRKDPLDRGFTGTAVGKVSRDHIVGTMRLSLADARVIRDVKYSLSRTKP